MHQAINSVGGFEDHSCSRKVSYGEVDYKRVGMRGRREGQ
jgi:hypothetical protein